MPIAITAPELYAIANGSKCEGKEECHWCGAACKQEWGHDDVPRIVGYRTITTAKRPGNPWICRGCMMFRRPRITVMFMDNTFKDGQSPVNHSWWITNEDARALKPLDQTFYDFLLNPPLRFALALKDGDCKLALHLTPVNQFDEIMADTPLKFTLNNILLTWTVYELENALLIGGNGTEPGVQALLRMFGDPEGDLRRKEKRNGAGRPPALMEAKDVVQKKVS